MTEPKREIELTRENILNGTMRRWIATADPSLKIRTEEEHKASIAATLAKRPDGAGDVWLFAYGSLIWNPTIHTVERRRAEVWGHHRRFCLWTHLGRGTADSPGLTLGLERGGSCSGVVYRIAAAESEHELLLLWHREMLTGAYEPRWIKASTPEGAVRAVTFAMNTAHPRYAGKLPDERVAAVIARAEGALGPCCHYLFSTVQHLQDLGIRDRHLERIAHRVEELRATGQVSPG